MPVHADHVNRFIASEFSQWLGERYRYHDAEGGVHTAGPMGVVRCLYKSAKGDFKPTKLDEKDLKAVFQSTREWLGRPYSIS